MFTNFCESVLTNFARCIRNFARFWPMLAEFCRNSRNLPEWPEYWYFSNRYFSFSPSSFSGWRGNRDNTNIMMQSRRKMNRDGKWRQYEYNDASTADTNWDNRGLIPMLPPFPRRPLIKQSGTARGRYEPVRGIPVWLSYRYTVVKCIPVYRYGCHRYR